MRDECLLQLYQYLIPEARAAFNALGAAEPATMEHIMRAGQLSTQQIRKAVWGLASTGLTTYERGLPVRLSDNGRRLVRLLAEQQKSR